MDLVRQCIGSDPVSSSLCALFEHADKAVIQVDGIGCVGVPIRSPNFVQQFVAVKASAIVHSGRGRVQVVPDPLDFHE